MSADRTRDLSKEERSARIKKAAIEVFAEQGYHKAKVSTIVARVGVAQGTFYLYYKGKQELFGELLEDFLQLIRASVADWEVGHLDTLGQMRASLIDLGERVMRVLLDNRSLARIFFKEALAVQPEFTQQISRFYEDLGDMMTGINRLNHARGLLRPQDYRVVAYCTLGMVERNIQQFIVNAQVEPDEARMREVVREIVDLFLYGAGAWPSGVTGEATAPA